jgi:uncharacterized OB-fold protein
MTGIDPAAPADAPRDDLSEHWWEALQRQEFLLQRSTSTGRFHFYPRTRAVGTLRDDLEWVPAAGGGTVYSFTVVNWSANPEFAADCPYTLALVDLDEGVRITTRIIDAEPGSLRCGIRVQLAYRAARDGSILPYVTPTIEGEVNA